MSTMLLITTPSTMVMTWHHLQQQPQGMTTTAALSLITMMVQTEKAGH
jgi:tRNA U55 pseudouridine synthase TruB